jgi:hypothetical protein
MARCSGDIKTVTTPTAKRCLFGDIFGQGFDSPHLHTENPLMERVFVT